MSVIVTAYNVERFIAAAIDSALEVAWPSDRIEIIVVNDGSTDSTAQILEGYGDKIRLFSQPNMGCASAMNVGLENARGDVIAFLDGDDMWPEDKLRRQLRLLQKHRTVGLVYGDMEVIDSAGEVIEPSFLAFAGHQPARGRILGRLLADNFVLTGSIVVRADLRHLFFPIPAATHAYDWYVVSRIAEAFEIEFINKSVSRYRFHGQNMTLGITTEKAHINNLRDVEFTRTMLTTYDLSSVSTAEMVRGIAVATSKLTGAATFRGVPVESLLTQTPQSRQASSGHAEQAWNQIRQGRLDEALRSAVQAVAFDPLSPQAVQLFDGLFSRVMRAAGTAASELPADTRKVAVQADATELLMCPDLLSVWRHEFSDADDVTLVAMVEPHRHEEVAAALAQLAAQAGFHDEDAPDLVVHACSDPSRLRYLFAAGYTRTGNFGGPKLYDDSRISDLRSALTVPLALAA